jgi:hypothetical protein
MVIETFREADPAPVGERFRARGRMMPEGLEYHASWVDARRMRCFQVMEAPSMESLQVWVANWQDLVDFEIVPVQTSADFWSQRA